MLIAFAAWALPLHAASALKQTNTEQPILNYEQFHDHPTIKPIDKPSSRAIKSTPRGTYSGRYYSKIEVQDLIRHYSVQYGISADLPLRIARCESNFRWDAKNPSSTASGVFQFLSSTWATKPLAQQGASVFNADANVHTAIWLMSLGKTSMWNSSKSCWNS
jgi:muramidase (phage lysozyme)